MPTGSAVITDQVANLDENNLKAQKEKVWGLRKRLHAREAFLLPEVWDLVSARIVEEAGFGLIGISSEALAWTRALKRTDRVAPEVLVETAKRICGSAKVPVVADLEGIAGRPLEEIGQSTQEIIRAGCIGIAIGDGGRGGAHGIVPAKEMAAAIQAVKTAALETKLPVVIMARTEAFLLDPPPQSPFETAVERAEVYFAAGADCISVPGAHHIQIVERLSNNIGGPLCVTVGITPAPGLSDFAGAGAACVALGTVLLRTSLGTLRMKAEEVLAFGHFNGLDKAITEEYLESLLT
ncbi:MAG: isocitrate lyase/phosphoenolpyruvate mutase family protein [Rhodomicrobium sp.]